MLAVFLCSVSLPHWSPVCLPSNDSSNVSTFSRARWRAGCHDHFSSRVPRPSLLSQHPLEVGIGWWKHWNSLSESVLEPMSTSCRNASATVSMALPHVERSSASQLRASPRSQSPGTRPIEGIKIINTQFNLIRFEYAGRKETSMYTTQSISNNNEDVSRCLKMSQDVSRCLKMSQDVSRCLKMSQGYSKYEVGKTVGHSPCTKNK